MRPWLLLLRTRGVPQTASSYELSRKYPRFWGSPKMTHFQIRKTSFGSFSAVSTTFWVLFSVLVAAQSFSIKGAIKLIIACAHPFFNDFCKIPQKNCKYFSCGHFDLVCIVRFLNFVFDFVKNLVLSCSLRKKKIKICKKRSEIFFNENRDFFGFCDLISAKFWIFSSSSCRFWV